MHKPSSAVSGCLSLCISPYTFLHLSTFPLTVPRPASLFHPAVSIQSMERWFFIFSLLSRTALSNFKWKQGCKGEDRPPRPQKLLSKTKTRILPPTPPLHTHTQREGYKNGTHTSDVGTRKFKWEIENKGITAGRCF